MYSFYQTLRAGLGRRVARLWFLFPWILCTSGKLSLAGETAEKPPQRVGEEGGGRTIERDSWKEDVFGEGSGAQK